jgi:pimeloyl-ACP methyl ester carboxylesterase
MTSPAAIRRRLNGASYLSARLAGRYAFPLFVRTGPRAPVRPAEQPVHDLAVVDRLPVDGRELAVYRWGESGRRVLLMHGFEGRASNMAGFAAGLHGLGMTAVAFDNFGHGDSEGDRATIVDVAGAVRAVAAGYGPFHAIIAHSFGGLCAYHAVRSGVDVERMVTIGALCDFGSLPEWFSARLGLRPGITADLRRRSEDFFRPETDIWARFSATYQAEQWKIPLLVIHDENDKEIPVSQGRKISAAYERAEYLETRGLGHRRVLGDPGVVSAALEFAVK